MKNTKSLLASLTVLAVLSTASSAYAAGEVIGINAAVKGDVTIQTGAEEAKQAMVKDPLHIGDEVNSAQLSTMQLLLKDQTIFTIGPDCVLTIDKFIYDPDNNSSILSANVAKGMFRFMSGNISKSGPDSVSINTPVASMGVRGTIVEALIGAEAIAFARQAGVLAPNAKADADGATLFVLRGPGARNEGKNTRGEVKISSGGGSVVLRKSGLATFVANKNSRPSDPFMIAESIFEVFNQRLRSAPTGGPSFKPFELSPYRKKPLDRLDFPSFDLDPHVIDPDPSPNVPPPTPGGNY